MIHPICLERSKNIPVPSAGAKLLEALGQSPLLIPTSNHTLSTTTATSAEVQGLGLARQALFQLLATVSFIL